MEKRDREFINKPLSLSISSVISVGLGGSLGKHPELFYIKKPA